MVARYVVDVGAGDVAALCNADGSADPAALRAAVNHVERWRLMTRTATMDAEKSMAPSADNRLQHWAERRASRAEAIPPPPHGTTAGASQRRWVQRWRGRWGGKYGKICFRDELASSELRVKAATTSVRLYRNSATMERTSHCFYMCVCLGPATPHRKPPDPVTPLIY